MKSAGKILFRRAARISWFILGFITALTVSAADECVLTYPISTLGVVSESGRATSTNGLSVKGQRQFLTFSLPKFDGKVVGASLYLTMQSLASDVPLDYTLYEVTNSVPRVSLGGGTVYSDLGDGEVLGSGRFDPRSTSRDVIVPLNSDFVQLLDQKSATATTTYPVALGAVLTGGNSIGDEFISTFWMYLQVSIVPANMPPLVIGQSPQTVTAGGSVQFYVTQTSSPCPLTGAIRWRFAGEDIPGATNSYLNLSNVTTNQSGAYSVVVSNGIGSFEATTDLNVFAEVKVDSPPAVRFDGPTVEGPMGYPFHFCPNVEGWPTPVWQWLREGVPLLDQTNVCLDFSALESRHSGNYTLTASNSLGQASASIHLDVRGQVPAITSQSGDLSMVAGSDAIIYFSATGAPPPEFFLVKDGTNQPFALATPNSVSLFGLTLADAGFYSVLASNSLGMATSQVIRVTVRASEPRDRWSSIQQQVQIRSMTAAQGTIVAVGDQGGIFTSSTEPPVWDAQPPKNSADVNAIVYANNLFVAVTDDGLILTSKDAKTWDYAARADRSLKSVAYGNGLFVAAGFQLVMTSVDGLHWTRVEESKLLFDAISFGNGVFVAGAWDVGTPSSGSGRYLMTSVNGIDWQRVFPSPEVEQVAFLNDRFFAVGDDGFIAISADGSNWQVRALSTTRRFYDVVYGAGKYIAVGARGIIFSSADGSVWKQENSGTPDRLEAALYTGKYFIAAGENGTTLVSTDGSHWAAAADRISADLDGMVTTSDLVVAVGKDGTILTSTNGVNFSIQQSGVTNNLHGIGWNGTLFVAVGEPGVIFTSLDAVHWTQRSVDLNTSLKQAVFLNDLWIAVGTGGVLLTSPDAVTWTQVPHLTYNDLNDAAYGNGTYAVIGDGYPSPSGTLLTSKDGAHWTVGTLALGKNARSITYANGIFLVTANDSFIATSRDAVTWNFQRTFPAYYSSPVYYPVNLRSGFWTGRDWVLVGNFGSILTSPDLVTWTAPRRSTSENLHAVGRFHDRLMTIGNAGFIGRSDRWFMSEFISVSRQTPSGVSLEIQVESAGDHQLQTSSDLKEWKTISTFSVARPGRVSLQPDAAAAHTFYRTRLE